MKVLVCGGRNYTDSHRVSQVLDKLHSEAGITMLIEGGANGADTCARHWADRNKVQVWTFAADWDAHGSFAGPMRNSKMLNEGQPNIVVAFPGGRGTADMCRKARKDGVEVYEIAP